jgi:hypothetical protein
MDLDWILDSNTSPFWGELLCNLDVPDVEKKKNKKVSSWEAAWLSW